METPKKLKEITDRMVLNAEIILRKEKQLIPTIFVFSDLSDKPIPIRVSTATDDALSTLEELIKTSAMGAEALILILALYTREVLQKKGGPQIELPTLGDLRGHPDTMEVISVFVYTKGATAVRQVAYVEKEGDYTFCDMGWEDSDRLVGMLANPFNL